MPTLGDTFKAINDLKARGTIDDYAVAGAMALVFWTEPVATFDLDVLVTLARAGSGLIRLDGIYAWAETHGYPVQAEHILVEGMPTQFLPSPNPLAQEAVTAAVELDYQGVPVRVVRPEYLIALYLEPQAKTHKRRERAGALLDLPNLNRALVDEILERHGLRF